jgi:thioredoxin 1
MDNLRIEVFTSPSCPHCPAAVKATEAFLEANPELAKSISWKTLSLASPEGSKLAREYGIRSVPTIVATNEKGIKTAYVGAPIQRTYKAFISEAMKA